MKNALERMDEIINSILNSEPLSAGILSAEQVKWLIKKAIAEKDKIRKELMHPAEVLQTFEAWKMHIKHYQQVITYLADLVVNCREQNTVVISGKQSNELLHLLFYLLAIIQQRFPNYLDRNDKMPLALQLVKRNILKDMLQRFTIVFNSEINDPQLYEALIKPITSFLQEKIQVIYSYSETDYLYHYLFALIKLPLNVEEPAMELIKIVVRMNCNSDVLKKYIIEKMKSEVQNCGSDKLVKDNLDGWKEFFRDIPVRPNKSWNKKEVCLKEDLLEWIERKLPQEVNTQESKSNKRIQSAKKTNETGIFFMMTVEELALMIRVEKDSGYLSNQNITEMMQEIALIVHTTKQYEVSWQNIYNCYYSIDMATIKSLRDKIFVMNRTLHQLEVKLKNKESRSKK